MSTFKFQLFLDSRTSTGPNPSQCVFELNDAIVGAVECRVLSFTFANTLFNVQAGANTLIFNTPTTVVIPPGNYSATALATYIDSVLLATPAFVANMGGAPDAVVLVNDQLSWSIGTNVLTGGTFYPSLVLQQGTSLTGNFVTDLFLAIPLALGLHSTVLNPSDRRFIGVAPQQMSNAFYTHVIASGFGQMEPTLPAIARKERFQLSSLCISRLDVAIRDSTTFALLPEMNHWCLLLEFTLRPQP